MRPAVHRPNAARAPSPNQFYPLVQKVIVIVHAASPNSGQEACNLSLSIFLFFVIARRCDGVPLVKLYPGCCHKGDLKELLALAFVVMHLG